MSFQQMCEANNKLFLTNDYQRNHQEGKQKHLHLTTLKKHENREALTPDHIIKTKPKRNLHLYSAPRRSMRRRGKARAQGVSARRMSRPKRKGWLGSGRPSRDWKVGRTYRKPACSLLPSRPRLAVEWLRWLRTLPTVTEEEKGHAEESRKDQGPTKMSWVTL